MKKGEAEVKVAITNRFHEKNLSYQLTETDSGFEVRPQDATVVYQLHCHPLGWVMYLEVEKDEIFDMDLSFSHPYEALWEDLNRINFHYFLHTDEWEEHVHAQHIFIEQVLFPFSKLIVEKKQQENTWQYKVRDKSGHTGMFTISYQMMERYWDVDFEGFMEGFHFVPAFYDLQEAVWSALDNLNKENMQHL